jgi:hypothetical protein
VARESTVELELLVLDRGLPTDPRLARRLRVSACVRERGRHHRVDVRVRGGLTVAKASLWRLAASEVAKAVKEPHQYIEQLPDALRLTGSGNSYSPGSP